MNALIKKYANCCRFCFGPLNDNPTVLGSKELSDIDLIKKLMGIEMTDFNDYYTKVLKNVVCKNCESTLVSFMSFRIESREKFKAFKREVMEVQKGKVSPSPIFVCDECFQHFPLEDVLHFHRKNTHKLDELMENMDMETDVICEKTQFPEKPKEKSKIDKTYENTQFPEKPKEKRRIDMEIDKTCGKSQFSEKPKEKPRIDMEIDKTCGKTQFPEKTKENSRITDILEEKTEEDLEVNEKKIQEYLECTDCNRKFLLEDVAVYLRHMHYVHPKKVPCPFGCMAKAAKKKMFKNVLYLTYHIKTHHATTNLTKIKEEIL